MIDGLKLAMGGHEIILAIDTRIEQHRANIQYKRDEIDGKIEQPTGDAYSVPAEAVEEEIRQLDYRLRTLTFIRDHVLPGETYLVGRRDLKFAGLLPTPAPAVPEIDLSRGIRWVTRPIEVD